MQAIIEFFMANQAVLGGVVVAILDFAIAINKNLEANSLIQAILGFLKPKAKV